MPGATVTVICNNPNCIYFKAPRTVGLTHLGQDVYQHPTLVCGCSVRMPLQMLPDYQQPAYPLEEVASDSDSFVAPVVPDDIVAE